MPKYCPKCGHSFPEDWDECNECEVELVYEEKDRIIELSDIDKKYYDYKSRVYMDEECSQREIKNEANIPKCPICSSPNIEKIGALERGANIAMLGIFSKKINKSFKCKNCGYTF